MKAIILAAGMGTRLESVAGGIPKCMVEVSGVPLIDRLIRRIGETDIDEVIVVTGYKADVLQKHVRTIDHPLAKAAVFVYNDRYADMGNFYSLLVAKDAVGDDSFVKIDGDVLLDAEILPRILSAEGPAVLGVERRDNLGGEEMKVLLNENGQIAALNKHMDPKCAVGEYIGVDRIDREATTKVFEKLRQLIDYGETGEYYERAYERLILEGEHFVLADVTGCSWTEIDDAADLQHAQTLNC